MKVIVIGAGLAGLVAARSLSGAGHDVTVFDKGRSVGGRLATRRIGTARLDHGAQFFTVRSDRFAEMSSAWLGAEVVHEWCRGFDSDDGHPRYVGTGGMTSIAKHLAAGLDVRCSTLVFTVRRAEHGWIVVNDDGSEHSCDSLIVTAPIPQSYSLLFNAEIGLPKDLVGIDYDRTIGLLVVLTDDTHRIGPPGGRQNADGVFSFIGDNRAKGVSATPALTFHANPDWSLTNWEADNDELARQLMARAAEYIGPATVSESQVKKWRFAIPRTVWPDPCWTDETGTLALAGDAFAGPRVEGAALSGLAAAQSVMRGIVS